jgi:hypothetical protein
MIFDTFVALPELETREPLLFEPAVLPIDPVSCSSLSLSSIVDLLPNPSFHLLGFFTGARTSEVDDVESGEGKAGTGGGRTEAGEAERLALGDMEWMLVLPLLARESSRASVWLALASISLVSTPAAITEGTAIWSGDDGCCCCCCCCCCPLPLRIPRLRRRVDVETRMLSSSSLRSSSSCS